VDNAKIAAQYLLSAAAIAFLYFGMLRPMLKRLSGEQPGGKAAGKEAEKAEAAGPGQEAATPETQAEGPAETQAAAAGKRAAGTEAEEAPKARTTYQENLQTAKQMALQEPRMVANVIKDWVNGNE
jgi:flagellar M-ring protein FliF